MVKFESVTERERSLSRLSLGRSPTKMPTQLIHPADEDESGVSKGYFTVLPYEIHTSGLIKFAVKFQTRNLSLEYFFKVEK